MNVSAVPTTAGSAPMAFNVNQRSLVLGGLLLATLAVSAFTLLSGTDETVVEPVARPAKVGAPATGSAGATRRTSGEANTEDLTLTERPPPPARIPNLFSAYTYKAPEAAPVAQVIAKPHAPPLPFTYTGHLEIDGTSTFLMMQGDAPLSLTLGSVIGNFKLVEAAKDHLVFHHEPTGESVVMTIPAAN